MHGSGDRISNTVNISQNGKISRIAKTKNKASQVSTSTSSSFIHGGAKYTDTVCDR